MKLPRTREVVIVVVIVFAVVGVLGIQPQRLSEHEAEKIATAEVTCFLARRCGDGYVVQTRERTEYTSFLGKELRGYVITADVLLQNNSVGEVSVLVEDNFYVLWIVPVNAADIIGVNVRCR